MAVSLKKGEGVSLSKEQNDLSQITIGLGWDVVQPKSKGLLGSLFGKKEEDYDLDAIAFLLGENGKVNKLGNNENGRATLVGGDVIFFNSQRHPSGAIWLTGDNRTGAGEGDDEQIIVKLGELGSQYQRILFIVSIYDGKNKEQDFGKVSNAYIRAVDARGKEICRYNISGDASFSAYRSLTFAEVARQDSGWTFRAIGTPHETDSFVDLLTPYA